MIEAALRAGIPYVDVAAEIEANLDTFTHFAERARAANTVVVPAMAFFGGLGDLLVTAAMGDWTSADEAHIAYGLSSWHPTAGTRTAGAVSRERRNGRRVRYSGGRLEYHDDALPTLKWSFPDPMGPREVIGEFTMADVVTVPSHLTVPEVRSYMTADAARDLSAPDTPAPAAVDEDGPVRADVRRRRRRTGRAARNAVRWRAGGTSTPSAHRWRWRRWTRVLTGRTRTVGVASAGAVFDAPDFLGALAAHISLELFR